MNQPVHYRPISRRAKIWFGFFQEYIYLSVGLEFVYKFYRLLHKNYVAHTVAATRAKAIAPWGSYSAWGRYDPKETTSN
jgi:hypothetical protein